MIKNFNEWKKLNEWSDTFNAVSTSITINKNEFITDNTIDVNELNIGDTIYQKVIPISPVSSKTIWTSIEPNRDETLGIYKIKNVLVDILSEDHTKSNFEKTSEIECKLPLIHYDINNLIFYNITDSIWSRNEPERGKEFCRYQIKNINIELEILGNNE